MHRNVRAAVAAVLLAAALGAASIGSTALASAAVGPLRAHAAHALKATDTAHLHYVRSSGSMLLDEGSATGTIPGRMRASVEVGATISGTFVLYLHGGTISGHGSAIPHGSGVYESFKGTLVVTGGSGRYRHAHGRANLYGTFNRSSYALLVQTAGTLRY